MTFPLSVLRRLCLAGVALAIAASAAASGRPLLRIVSADLPPLVVEHPTAGRPGALYELVQALSARMQLTTRIEFLPWPRAILMASKPGRTAIFPLTRQAAREPAFRWLAPLYEENYVFLAPRTSRFDVSRVEAMKGMRIAVIRGGAQAALLRERGFRIVEARSVDEVHRFMLGGMADAAVGERAIVRNALASRHALDQFHVSPPAYSNTAWLAGSLDFTEQDAAAFQRAMQQLRADGTYQKILAKYGLD